MTMKKTILSNGSRNVIIHAYMKNDGLDQEFTNHNLVDPTDYDPFADVFQNDKMKLTITQIWHSFRSFSGLLSFDQVSPIPSWVLTDSTGPHVDFRHFGGLADRFQGTETPKSSNRYGVVLLTTKGFAEANAEGSLILELKKTLDE